MFPFWSFNSSVPSSPNNEMNSFLFIIDLTYSTFAKPSSFFSLTNTGSFSSKDIPLITVA